MRPTEARPHDRGTLEKTRLLCHAAELAGDVRRELPAANALVFVALPITGDADQLRALRGRDKQ